MKDYPINWSFEEKKKRVKGGNRFFNFSICWENQKIRRLHRHRHSDGTATSSSERRLQQVKNIREQVKRRGNKGLKKFQQ